MFRPYQIPENDEVHVWTAFQSASLSELPVCESVLSVEEKQRAARFHRAEDRSRYGVAHGILRQLLGGYLSVPPGGLTFTQNAYGKPALVPYPGQPALSFNLAHSGDVILFALAVDRPVGIDVETVRRDFDVMELAQNQFSELEISSLRSIADPAERTEAFFRCWTRKEAYLKARGEGLGFPLKKFSVTFGRDESPSVSWAADDPLATERWSVRDVPVVSGYVAAMVCSGGPVKCNLYRWNADSRALT